MDAPTKVLKLFLDLMHMRQPPSQLVWSQKDRLLKLCDDYGCASVAERAVFTMHESVHKDPWAVFCLASQRGNLALAKSALRALGHGEYEPRVAHLTPAMVGGVTLPYLLGLFNAVVKIAGHHASNGVGEEHHHHEAAHDGAKITWKAIADKFHPVMG